MLRYSEISRDFSSESLSKIKFFQNRNESDEELNASSSSPLPPTKYPDKMLTESITRIRKISTPTLLSNSPGPPPYFQYFNTLSSSSPLTDNTVPAHIKTQSLPSNSSSRNNTNTVIKNYSCAIFDILRIPPEDFASQLTLLDLPIFLSIQPDELTSCAWNKKNKMVIAPNVVAFTKRFNHVSFWTVQEILCGGSSGCGGSTMSTIKQRTEMLSYFIRIAKKLYELNNFHSLFAIISALQSASLYRLAKTWSSLSKKDKQTFDRLAEVFSDTQNWSNLRSHIESLKLPCIPYLGLYLTDLVYIDMAHPHSGGLESQQRTLKMNNILRIISNYQQSDYSHLTPIPHIQDYLNSIRYIEELQKFVEDDQYKLSLRLEPSSSLPNSSSSSNNAQQANNAKENNAAMTDIGSALASLNLSPAKASSGSLRLHSITSKSKFVPGHRKCSSLGSNIFGKYQNTASNLDQKTNTVTSKTFHLLDDSELEDSSRNNLQLLQVEELASPTDIPLQASQSTAENCTLLTRLEDNLQTDNQICTMQGSVRRKTLLKNGKKPTVASWQRYWLQMWTSSLVYFSPKSFKGHQRSDFKREPCKLVSVIGCQVVLGDNFQEDCFQLVDQQHGNIYKFRTGSKNLAQRWCKNLQQAANGCVQSPLPSNLMSFE